MGKSALELLGDTGDSRSAVNLLDGEAVVTKSAVDLLEKPSTTAPTTTPPSSFTSKLFDLISKPFQKEDELPLPLHPEDYPSALDIETGFPEDVVTEERPSDILGIQMDVVGPLAQKMGIGVGSTGYKGGFAVPPLDTKEWVKATPAKQSTMNSLKSIAKKIGVETLAASELAMSLASSMILYIPSKLYGVMALPFGREVAEVAEEEMAKLGYQPLIESGREAAELVGKGFELFLTPARNIGEEVSRLDPRAGYLAEFGAELAEFVMTGGIVKGARARFKPSIKQVDKLMEAREKLESDSVKAKELAIDQIPDEALKGAQLKVLEVQKIQTELEIKKLKESVDYKEPVKQDLKEKGKEVQAVKERAIKVEPEVDLHPAVLTMREELGLTNKEYKSELKRITDQEDLTGLSGEVLGKVVDELGLGVKRVKKETVDIDPREIENLSGILNRVMVIGSPLQPLITSFGQKLGSRIYGVMDRILNERGKYPRGNEAESILREAIKPKDIKPEKIPKEAEAEALDIYLREFKAKEIDTQTGLTTEALEGERSPFFQDKAATEAYKKIFEGRKIEDVELYTQHLLNRVNRWYHGEEIDVGAARNNLSKIAARADEFRKDFLNPNDFVQWKDVVSEAARWARTLDRFGVERVPEMAIAKPPKGVRIEHRGKIYALPKGERISLDKEGHIDAFKIQQEMPFSAVMTKVSPKRYELTMIKVKGDLQRQGIATKMLEELRGEAKRQGAKLFIESDLDTRTEFGGPFVESLKKRGVIDSVTEEVRLKIERRGPTFYTGIPAKEIVAAGKRAMEAAKRARKLKKFRPIAGAREVKRALGRDWADKGANIRLDMLDKLGQEGYEIVQRSTLIKGANPRATMYLDQLRKEYNSGLTKNEKRIRDDLIFNMRIVDIGKYKTKKEFAFPEGSSPTEAVIYVELFDTKGFENIPPNRAAKIRRSAETFFEWMKRPLDDLETSGLISAKEKTDLASHNYTKFKLAEIYDKQYTSKVGGKPITVYDSGIQMLAKGRKTDVLERNSEIMAHEVFNRSYGRILRNDANNFLYELSLSNPKNPFARTIEGSGEGKIPSGWSRIFAYRKGERKSIYLSPDMAKEWITSNPEISYRSGMYLRWLFGAPILKTFATGIEWGFALANIPRDVMHIFFTARVYDPSKPKIGVKGEFPFLEVKKGNWRSLYSTNLPIFFPQIGMDIARVFPDVVTKGPKWQDYIERGGGMEFLVHQGQLFRRGRQLESNFSKMQDLLGKFGLISEGATRIAITERVARRKAREEGVSVKEARKNNAIMDEATFAARDYLDFGQGGGQAKAADSAIPYLNPIIQATRGMIRAARDNPLVFAWKVGQLGAATTLVYAAAKSYAPKTTEALRGSYNMRNNLCIPVGDEQGFEDEKGQMRYWGFKIPLDSTQKFFKSFFEASYDRYIGDEPNVDSVVKTFGDISPVGVSQLPPTVSGTLGYVANKDFWQMEDIQRKGELFPFFTVDKDGKWVGSSEEYDEHTSEFFKAVGRYTRLSPKRTQFAAEELVTGNSMWFYLMGRGYDELFKDVPKDEREKHWPMILSKTPVFNRFIFVTNPYSKYAEGIDKAEDTGALERHVQNKELDRLTDGYLFTKSIERREVFKYISSFKQKEIRDRLTDRFDFQYAIRKLPERSFWLRLAHLTPDVRADRYYARWKTADEEERKQLAREAGTIGAAGGVLSPAFWDEFSRVRREDEAE